MRVRAWIPILCLWISFFRIAFSFDISIFMNMRTADSTIVFINVFFHGCNSVLKFQFLWVSLLQIQSLQCTVFMDQFFSGLLSVLRFQFLCVWVLQIQSFCLWITFFQDCCQIPIFMCINNAYSTIVFIDAFFQDCNSVLKFQFLCVSIMQIQPLCLWITFFQFWDI